MPANRLFGRREFLADLAACGTATVAGCSEIPPVSTPDQIRLQTIWPLNGDSSRSYTFNVRLPDGESLVFEDAYEVPPMDENKAAGEVDISGRLPDSPGKYVLEAWTEAATDRRGEVAVYEETDAPCTVIDVSVTSSRDYPAIFNREDCN